MKKPKIKPVWKLLNQQQQESVLLAINGQFGPLKKLIASVETILEKWSYETDPRLQTWVLNSYRHYYRILIYLRHALKLAINRRVLNTCVSL